jgi:hypothetical protein
MEKPDHTFIDTEIACAADQQRQYDCQEKICGCPKRGFSGRGGEIFCISLQFCRPASDNNCDLTASAIRAFGNLHRGSEGAKSVPNRELVGNLCPNEGSNGILAAL